MKYLPILLLLSLSAQSQVIVDDVNINELEDVHLCQIVMTGKVFSNKVTVTIDYGQFIKWSKGKGSIITGEDGKPVKFKSIIDALNFMENNGWAYLDSYVVTINSDFGSGQNVYHYTFKKKTSFGDDKADEAKRKAEEEAKRKAEYEAAKNKYENVFGDGKGQGNNNKPGNQGDPNSNVLEGISTGTGIVGGGLSNRGGRGPSIEENFLETGIVVVEVCVDANGRVTKAEFTLRGSSTQSPTLIKIAERNARKWAFKNGSVDKQCGTITYNFKVR